MNERLGAIRSDRRKALEAQKRTDPYQITVMPDQETLQDYLRGHSAPPRVVYNLEKGVFERQK